ncbi:MAG: quercetin 2,3-dioxygenase [Rhodocyclales bacterium RIFCSPLOWO2_02_FULL_63_24]|nr:MAG: quercetin 2,3-dioxygenase [Rhodocyclales bacterium RIFCSPLOWO2_02_FULL_63_24]
MSSRRLQTIIRSVATSDGAGVSLRRSLGQSPAARVDPFLMLDEFFSDDPDDYIAGFPPHPHRGFETVTYMLDGHMLHEDHLGNRGDLLPGGAQWMTAGRGIIHSEMPQQESGRMRGFQLWINLPAAEKMKPAHYRDIRPEEIPQTALPGGGEARVIAGRIAVEGREIAGPVQGLCTEPLYIDVRLPSGGRFTQVLPAGHNAFVYAYEGSLGIGPADDARRLAAQDAGVLAAGDSVGVHAVDGPARFLLLAARPLGEPVVQHGPFVMNSREEIEQAISDYRLDRLV